MAQATYLEAIRQGLWEEMESDPSVFCIGEDIGIYGGAFKVTDGFIHHFGPQRVIDTPIAESAIVGAAFGAALTGMRPVVEFQFMDFIGCAFNQIVNMVAKSHYRWGAPAVMRLGHHVHDLVEGAADEVHELELHHRTHARERRAERRAHNRRLGDRCVDHALRAEVMDKSIRHLERAAVDANVFANAEDTGIRLHLFPESLPYCFQICCLSHCFLIPTEAFSEIPSA